MTVLELLNKVNRNDLCIRLTEFYPSIFNTIEKAKKYTDIFFKDNEKLILDEISEDDKDFVVVVNKLYDEPDDYSLFEEGTPIDTSKLTMSYYVDGIHLNHLKKHKDELCYTLDEVREKNLFPIYTYGLDFLPKTTTLAYPICQVSLDEYDELDVAAAIFYEVTFYGLENNDIIDRGKELDQRVDSLDKENFENTKKISIDDFTDEDESDNESNERKPLFKPGELEHMIAIDMEIGRIDYEEKRKFFLKLFK